MFRFGTTVRVDLQPEEGDLDGAGDADDLRVSFTDGDDMFSQETPLTGVRGRG